MKQNAYTEAVLKGMVDLKEGREVSLGEVKKRLGLT